MKALRSEHGDRVTVHVGVWAALGVCKKYKDSITTARFGLPRGRPLAAAGMHRSGYDYCFYMFFVLQQHRIFRKECRTRANFGLSQGRPLAAPEMCQSLYAFVCLHVCCLTTKTYVL